MVTQGAANRRAGAKYEADVVNHFRGEGYDTERLRLSGKQDEGDIVVRIDQDLRLIVEAKAGKNVRPRYWFDDEAVPEARNYAKRRSLLEEEVVPVLAMKSHNKSIDKSLITIELGTLVHLLHRGSGK